MIADMIRYAVENAVLNWYIHRLATRGSNDITAAICFYFENWDGWDARGDGQRALGLTPTYPIR